MCCCGATEPELFITGRCGLIGVQNVENTFRRMNGARFRSGMLYGAAGMAHLGLLRLMILLIWPV